MAAGRRSVMGSPLIVSWTPGMTEGGAEPSFIPDSFDEIRWCDEILRPLRLSLDNFEGIVREFSRGQMHVLETWLEARMRHIESGLGWKLKHRRRKLIYRYCLTVAQFGIDLGTIGRAPHWPHPRVGLPDDSTTR